MLRRTLSLFAALAVTVTAGSAFGQGDTRTNQFWWPDQLDLTVLRQHETKANPYGDDFNYREAFASLDLDEVKADIVEVMTTSQDWWPADWGHYGPLFIRMAWHSAGTYRVADGRGGARGGQLRFDPLNSWPDNANLDKARRVLWPVKQKYGRALSWADLMILAGNVALEDMGFQTLGFSGGREDEWQPELVDWGPETEMLGSERFDDEGRLEGDVAAMHMGLIYVNPAGPGGEPDPVAAADHIRASFGRMAMNDEETVALIAGGHTFGKVHGAHDPAECVGPEPAAAGVEEQGFGWRNECGKGMAEDTVTSEFEGAWTHRPTEWTMLFLQNLYRYNWELTESPAGAPQWVPAHGAGSDTVPDAHVEGLYHQPIMLTTDLSLREDPAYREISRRFLDNPEEFEDAFARAWFKLTHRDMGPPIRYIGSEAPEEEMLWQDPIPEVDHELIDSGDIERLKGQILDSGLSVPELVRAAWASASTFRGTDLRGGANGARIRLEPQRGWEVNDPEELERVLNTLEQIQQGFNTAQTGNKRVSLADLIVLGGAAAIEQAASEAGYDVEVPFTPGRMDASLEQTDVESFDVLEPRADGFRNYYSTRTHLSPAEALIDRADLLTLTVREMTALVGGMRALGANANGSEHGVFTDRPGTLTNDFFVNLLGMETEWKRSEDAEGIYEGHDRRTGNLRWTATPVDLVFGSHAELRAVAEVYAQSDSGAKFVNDFVDAWTKVMTLDRFDLQL